MRVTRIYTGEDGQSHFEELDIPMNDGPMGAMSARIPTAGAWMRDTTTCPEVLDFHVAPRRQFVVHFSGRVEIECGDGTKRQFRAGDVFLADDTTGQGHISREIEGPRRQIFVAVDPELDLSPWRAG